ncbi:ubiquitin C-terminal hydrolase family protein [Verticillium alfalfae VaMs.102]|uniref:ubiquitinyl hydrolase 1 n=1 Tax=Verticillium alfalfae (strain VaMs.102 / ATCC MYA-4576 / FGSC 10136) TaxID=526221 RepID=C9S8X1_VERA1|nr:ubiquitin C-terminal hydrolase family protein [Verticillium alfalfae VaMs.102]EEY14048.1 ubiquitin C-terminal hydrolase family protein [Verticillium alfalfae VaMs.102]
MKAKRLFSVKDREKDKHGSHRRNKSSEPGHKNHSLSADNFFSLFKSDASRQINSSHEDKAKIEDVLQLLAEDNPEYTKHSISPDHIRQVLHSYYAVGDVRKAAEFIQMQSDASAGKIYPYNPNVQMSGAENREAVTCYLDSLLFSMFARMDAYEGMLKHEFTDEPRRKLVTLLRLWVNMLRSGKLIYTDMTKLIQDSLAECGWQDAKELEQQDTSEAFAFITETLQLPLLQLQVDLFHQGKNDDDDHKIVNERLLNLAVPPDPEGKGLRLEDCLEEYFNTQVDVLRDSNQEEKRDARRPTTPTETVHGLISGETAGSSRPTARHRSTSVIQHVLVDGKGRPAETDNSSLLERARRKSSTVVKAVTIPAWQFFRLIPWHSAGNSEPQNDQDVAVKFSQRPVVGICLKRYGLSDRMVPQRLNTFIDIPDSLRLPHFMLADEKHLEEDPNGFSTEYKLVLQSVVCHRGESVNSGHYIAFSRVAPKLLTDNRRHDLDPPPDYEEAQWAKFDDLHIESRVTYVDDIKQSIKEEMPYLLFYQIVPMMEVVSADETETEPPSYADSKASIATSTDPSLADSGHLGTAGSSSGDYFEKATKTQAPSIRFSSDIERPSRDSIDDLDPHSKDSRRTSINPLESVIGTPGRTPDTASPAITPNEETTRERFSRAAALFSNKSRSRPPSQAGEGRISLTMGRLGGFMRPSKEILRRRQSIGHMSARRPTPRKHRHEHGHKRGKSKVKGVQPERECILM